MKELITILDKITMLHKIGYRSGVVIINQSNNEIILEGNIDFVLLQLKNCPILSATTVESDKLFITCRNYFGIELPVLYNDKEIEKNEIKYYSRTSANDNTVWDSIFMLKTIGYAGTIRITYNPDGYGKHLMLFDDINKVIESLHKYPTLCNAHTHNISIVYESLIKGMPAIEIFSYDYKWEIK